MMAGQVSNLHVLVTVFIRRDGQPDIGLEFVVDTGFLCLPAPAVTALGLPFLYDLRARLADDSQVLLPVHGAVILWHGVERNVRVLATGKRPLLGTALLDGSDLFSQFREGGVVTIDNSASMS